MKQIIGLFIGFILITSCDNNHNKYYLERIDSVRYELDEALAGYNKFDSVRVTEIRNQVKTNCKSVRSDESEDVMSTFIHYSHIDKSMKQILKMDKRIKIETALAKTQLEDLYHDASKDLMEKEHLKINFREEKRIVQLLIDRMEYNTAHAAVESHRFDSLNPIIEQHIIKRN